MSSILYYLHDPMCSWCWAFRPGLQRLRSALPAEIGFRRLLGGLAEDTDEAMPLEMRRHIQDTWRRIQQRVPGTEFNFDFWRLCEPRRSTYRACRAVIAAREQGPGFEEPMLLAIQRAYYLQARNPSDKETLVSLAGEIGLNPETFRAAVDAARIHSLLSGEIDHSRAMAVHSFPSLVLEVSGGRWPIPVDYTDTAPMLETIRMITD